MANRLDPSTLFGIVLAGGMMGAAIVMGGDAKKFFDLPSVLIVILGTLAITAACYSFREVLRALGLSVKTIFYHVEDPQDAGMKLMRLADEARKNGILALQNALGYSDNEFLRKGINMIVDGIEPDQAEKLLRQDIQWRMERHQRGVAVLRKSGEIAPAMGLIGTLIGLVQMLGNLNDPSSIGPAMAVALLTTFYGAVMAYVVINPLATKLERNSQEELLTDQLYVKGIAAIGKRENPRRLEMVLNAVLPPGKRLRFYE